MAIKRYTSGRCFTRHIIWRSLRLGLLICIRNLLFSVCKLWSNRCLIRLFRWRQQARCQLHAVIGNLRVSGIRGCFADVTLALSFRFWIYQVLKMGHITCKLVFYHFVVLGNFYWISNAHLLGEVLQSWIRSVTVLACRRSYIIRRVNNQIDIGIRWIILHLPLKRHRRWLGRLLVVAFFIGDSGCRQVILDQSVLIEKLLNGSFRGLFEIKAVSDYHRACWKGFVGRLSCHLGRLEFLLLPSSVQETRWKIGLLLILYKWSRELFEHRKVFVSPARNIWSSLLLQMLGKHRPSAVQDLLDICTFICNAHWRLWGLNLLSGSHLAQNLRNLLSWRLGA